MMDFTGSGSRQCFILRLLSWAMLEPLHHMAPPTFS